VQLDGIPVGHPGPSNHPAAARIPNDKTLFMNQGDHIRITLRDTPDGLLTVIEDLTTGQQGFMIASAANGFETVDSSGNATPFNFRPEFDTATPEHVLLGFAHVGVMFTTEIGHNEQFNGDADDFNSAGKLLCSEGPVVPACYGQDTDYDGTSYVEDWPDGSDSHANPAEILSVRSISANGKRYDRVYDQILFESTANGANPDCVAHPETCEVQLPFPPMAFYPFFAAITEQDFDTGERRHERDFDIGRKREKKEEACFLAFGNFASSDHVDNFGGTTQYGAPDQHNRLELVSEIQPNPCIPDIQAKK
jgi:hypothetical protein